MVHIFWVYNISKFGADYVNHGQLVYISNVQPAGVLQSRRPQGMSPGAFYTAGCFSLIYAFCYDYNIMHITGNFIISLEILQAFVEIATTLLDMIRAESQEEILSKVRRAPGKIHKGVAI